MKEIHWAHYKRNDLDNLVDNGKVTGTNEIPTMSYVDTAIDKIITAHPEWDDLDQLSIWVKYPQCGVRLTVGKLR